MSAVRSRFGLILPFLALVLPVGVAGQVQETQEIIAELEGIQQRLMPLQERALEDSALRVEREETALALRQAMVAATPGIEPKLDRLEAMFEEMRTAQQQGDADRISALTGEARQIQPEIEEARAKAMAQPAVQQRIAMFQENLQRRMIQLDPGAEQLFRRAAELEAKLMGGACPPPDAEPDF